MNIWGYSDHFKGQALPASWEALGAGKNLRARGILIASGYQNAAVRQQRGGVPGPARSYRVGVGPKGRFCRCGQGRQGVYSQQDQ